MDEKIKTHLANSIEIAEVKSQLDENAKRLLANKQVLAWIMHHIQFQHTPYITKICMGNTRKKRDMI